MPAYASCERPDIFKLKGLVDLEYHTLPLLFAVVNLGGINRNGNPERARVPRALLVNTYWRGFSLRPVDHHSVREGCFRGPSLESS